MKNLKKVLALCLCMMLLVSCIPAAFAATVEEATIDTDAMASLTLYKYDWTNAVKDGVWSEESFISTGWQESYVEETLGGANRQGDDDNVSNLGNGQTSNGYAIKGVEFSFTKVADIVTFTESANDGHADYNMTIVLYAFAKDHAGDLLKAIGLEDGKNAYANAANTDKLDAKNYWYYESDVLNDALSAALSDNATTLKNALETFVKADTDSLANGETTDNGGKNGVADAGKMPYTDENGRSEVVDLEVGLYLCVETEVPEMVTCTTNPFFVSLPMTTISGNDHAEGPEGGHEWNYDVVLYPKNETGLITLEKTVRESKNDTGKNHGSDIIEDGFMHNGTGSAGDVMEYQILTTLPTITSQATAMTYLTFDDYLVQGLVYNEELKDVKIEIFLDQDCLAKAASWDMNSGKFTVSYETWKNESGSEVGSHMQIAISNSGLAEINGQNAYAIENENGDLYAGYSNYTMRVTYSATIVGSEEFVHGQDGNSNDVVLTWKRTSTDYYDQLVDDAHVYSFGIDLTKIFSDIDVDSAAEKGMYDHVKFKVWNNTDKYWVKARFDVDQGVYYVTDHVDTENEATIFTPKYAVDNGEANGRIVIKGLEDDEYIVTEIETADGYTLLKDSIKIVITAEDDPSRPCSVYSDDLLGLIQNDPRFGGENWENKGAEDLALALMPQGQLAHNYLTAHATVDGNDITMLSDAYVTIDGDDAESENAIVPLTVKNTRGFNPPKTGDNSAMILAMAGTVMMVGVVGFFCLVLFKKSKKEEDVAR